MKRITRWVIASTLLSAAAAVDAQTVTYDFTATVTSSGGLFSSVSDGTLISGSFTVDLADATSGAIADLGSLTAKGSGISAGGTSLGTVAPNGLVFSSIVQTGTVPFSSGSPAAYYTKSYVKTNPSNAKGTETFKGLEITETSPGIYSESFVTLKSDDAFSSGGLPALTTGAGAHDTGAFEEEFLGFSSEIQDHCTERCTAGLGARSGHRLCRERRDARVRRSARDQWPSAPRRRAALDLARTPCRNISGVLWQWADLSSSICQVHETARTI
jgi:hypothetical protein